MIEIRPARPADRVAVGEIALRTGDAGQDASALHDDPDLLAIVYAWPYLDLEQDLAFVAFDEIGVGGYVLAALDARAFAQTLEQRWWPQWRERYPLHVERRPADRELVEIIHRPHRPFASPDHPSELHIDLLPRMQGTGTGRRLMATLFDALVAAGSIGVHLGVDPRNEQAKGFYRHIGFTEVAGDRFVMSLP